MLAELPLRFIKGHTDRNSVAAAGAAGYFQPRPGTEVRADIVFGALNSGDAVNAHQCEVRTFAYPVQAVATSDGDRSESRSQSSAPANGSAPMVATSPHIAPSIPPPPPAAAAAAAPSDDIFNNTRDQFETHVDEILRQSRAELEDAHEALARCHRKADEHIALRVRQAEADAAAAHAELEASVAQVQELQELHARSEARAFAVSGSPTIQHPAVSIELALGLDGGGGGGAGAHAAWLGNQAEAAAQAQAQVGDVGAMAMELRRELAAEMDRVMAEADSRVAAVVSAISASQRSTWRWAGRD
jgi:hypothetical protein